MINAFLDFKRPHHSCSLKHFKSHFSSNAKYLRRLQKIVQNLIFVLVFLQTYDYIEEKILKFLKLSLSAYSY